MIALRQERRTAEIHRMNHCQPYERFSIADWQHNQIDRQAIQNFEETIITVVSKVSVINGNI